MIESANELVGSFVGAADLVLSLANVALLKPAEWIVLGYLANAVWQVPLVFGAAWVATRLARRSGALVAHRIWVAALLLETVLPAVRFDLRAAGKWLIGLLAGPSQGHVGAVRVAVGAAARHGGGLQLPGFLLAGVALLFAGAVAYFAVRLIWGIWRTERMRQRSEPVELAGDAARAWRRYGGASRNGLARAAELRLSGIVRGPVTVGMLRPAVLLPIGFLETVRDEDVDAVMAHELAHVRRWDFAKNLLYEAVSIAVAWHPVVWITRARLAESREMVCDAMAAEAVAGKEKYARSLLRLAALVADSVPVRTHHAIGIFDANSFERRVMNLTKKHLEVRLVHRIGMVAAAAVVVLATCATALAIRVEVGPRIEAVAAAGGGEPVKVDQGKLTHTIQPFPIYPAEAKEKKDTIDGAVVLAVIIGKDGSVESIKVKKSLRDDYDRSALDAVRDWRWEPYMLNGEPIEVDTTVTVNYSQGKEDEGTLIQKVMAEAPGTAKRLPKIIGQVDAVYPSEARASKDTLNGAVIVGATIGADGAVKETHIEHGLRTDYDESALTAVRQYRFQPALEDGTPVEAKIQIEVDFRSY